MEGIISIIPNLSIGVVCIGALVYVTDRFIKTLDSRSIAHEAAMQEREGALRNVEREVRKEISTHLSASTDAVNRATDVMEQVMHTLKHN